MTPPKACNQVRKCHRRLVAVHFGKFVVMCSQSMHRNPSSLSQFLHLNSKQRGDKRYGANSVLVLYGLGFNSYISRLSKREFVTGMEIRMKKKES